MNDSAEVRYMGTLEMDEVTMDIHPEYQMIPHDANKVASIIMEVPPLCNGQAMFQLLNERGKISQIYCALGSTMEAQESILIDHQEFSDSESVASTNSIHTMDDAMVDQLFGAVTSGSIDLDDYLVILTHANSNMSINEKQLSKNWRISPEVLRETLNVTTQKRAHVDNPSLARNFSTNDKMLRFKRLNFCFFMDTFFATKKA
eukprot:14441293-Ditylum_brightwellii.AAC.1